MAEVGFWLHGARGKLGGASLRKGADGKTIISEIVTPYNPRTNSQIYQRAIMATVMRAYSAGKGVFDHSFQGKSVGAQNMKKFLSLNARILRNLCVQEKNEMPWIHWGGAVVYPKCKARLVAYKTVGPIAFEGMQISEGSYQQTFFSITDAWEIPAVGYEPLKFGIPASLANETCAEYAKRCHLIADDLYTICGFYPLDMVFDDGYDDGVSHCGLQRVYYFFTIRMHVKSDFVSNSASAAGSTLEDIFTFDQPIGQGVINDVLKQKTVGEEFTMMDFFTQYILGDDSEAWCNIIRSRVNEGLRSTTFLKGHCAWADSGIIPAYVLPAWYPYIKGEPYPNPPIPPEPAAPELVAPLIEMSPGSFEHVLCAQLEDGTLRPYLWMGGVLTCSLDSQERWCIDLTPMNCESFMAHVYAYQGSLEPIECNLVPYQCALDGSDTQFKVLIDGGLYSFVSNMIEGQNMALCSIPLSEFHV